MAVDNVQVNTSTGVDGNAFTSNISNDRLTNQDFLKLMLEELKLQDPTKPMDSQRMLDTQMQMTSIETNLSTIKAMESLQNSFSQSALSNASNVIGKNIEDGNLNQSGVNKAYTVRSVESVDGDIQVKAQEILYLEDQIKDADGKLVVYDLTGNLLNADGTKTGQKIALNNPGNPITRDGQPVILDENNEEVTDHGYAFSGARIPVYSDQLTTLPFNSITKIF